MDEFDAYAPPAEEVGGKATPRVDAEDLPAPVTAAIQRLNEHLEDPENVAADDATGGGWLRPATRQFMKIGLGMLVSVPLSITLLSKSKRPFQTLSIGFCITGLLLGVVLGGALLSDYLSAPPPRSSSPTEALKNFLQAIKNTRYGRAWSMLCPSACEQSVRTPKLGQLKVLPRTVFLETAENFEIYIKSFLHSPTGNSFRVKDLALAREKGNMASVDVTGVFTKHHLWLYGIAFFAAFLSWKLVPIVMIGMFFVARRKHDVSFRKTLIRGSNGFWYVYSGNFIEAPNEVPETEQNPTTQNV